MWWCVGKHAAVALHGQEGRVHLSTTYGCLQSQASSRPRLLKTPCPQGHPLFRKDYA